MRTGRAVRALLTFAPLSAGLVATAAATAQAQPPATVPELPTLIPQPRQLATAAGHFALAAGTPIVAGDSALAAVAVVIAGQLAEVVGTAPRVLRAAPDTPALHLALDPALGADAYRLVVEPDGIRIAGGDAAGVLYGAQTLRQLLPVRGDGAAPLRVPAVRVEDAPRFGWRGMHLDVSRHFFTTDEVERFIDRMVGYKLNRLHLHLTDDQGWRLEIRRYPELTAQGAWRALNDHDRSVLRMGEENPDFHHLPADRLRGTGDSLRYGGFYTQDEMRALVAYAAARHVTIVPEIDMPGHMMAAIAAFPELSCTGSASWGQTFSVPLCPGKPEVYTFVEHVLDEVAALFPGPWVHVGGDEVEKTTWRDHAGSRALMEREGLDSLDELQSHFIRRVGAMLRARGKRMIGWDEIIDGGLAEGATVMWWRGWVPRAPVVAARAGHDAVLSPTSCCYFDYAETDETLASLYRWEPVPDSLTPAEARHVLGVQANLWTEYVATERQVEYMAFPRLLALAEVAWSDTARRAWPDFQRRLAAHYPRLDAQRIHYRVPEVPGLLPRTVVTADTTIALAPPAPGVALRYTTDGSLPTRASRPHTEPLRVTGDLVLRVRPFYPDGVGGPVQSIRIERQALRPADTPAAVRAGLHVAYHATPVTSVDSIRGEAARTTVVETVAVPPGPHAEAFALVFTGWVRVPQDGVYTFTLRSDDGSTLDVGGRRVVDNDGPHGPRAVAGQVALRAGLHPLLLRFFEGGGGYALELRWSGPGVEAGVVPASALVH